METKEATLSDLQAQVAAAEGIALDTRREVSALQSELADVAAAQKEWRVGVATDDELAGLQAAGEEAIVQTEEKVRPYFNSVRVCDNGISVRYSGFKRMLPWVRAGEPLGVSACNV